MIRLTVVCHQGAVQIAHVPYLRITGGAIWVAPHLSELPLVRCVEGRWQHNHVLWTGVRFEGNCRLIFGLPREPAGVSDPLTSLSICGTTLMANGIPFAVYEPEKDMWRGAAANTWWHAFRIETDGLRKLPSTTRPVLHIRDPYAQPRGVSDPEHPRSLN